MKENIKIYYLILIFAVLVFTYFALPNTPKLGGTPILTGPTSATVSVATSSTEVISAGGCNEYCSICMATSTDATNTVSLFIATSSDISVAQTPSNTAGRNTSYELDAKYHPCVEFVLGKNLTNRAIYGIATTTPTIVSVVKQ